jgi:filamentous hemagglutinin
MLLADRGLRVSQVILGGELTSAQSLAGSLNAAGGGGWNGAAVSAGSLNALNRTGSWAAMMWEQGTRVGHWVVVDGVNAAGNVIIRDPAGGTRYVMTESSFRGAWNGFAVFRQ